MTIMSTMYPSTKAAHTALIELGFRARTRKVNGITRFSEFVFRPIMNGAGERICNMIVFHGPGTEARFMDVAEKFLARTAELGSPWKIETVKVGDREYTVVSN